MTDSTATRASLAPDLSTITAALWRARRAPSIHNSQPWRWEFDGTHLYLYRDESRHLTAADPSGRQLVISCGAMLHHLRTVLAATGWRTDLDRFPDPARPDLLARLDFRPWPDPPEGVGARAAAIERRRTDRHPLAAPEDFGEVLRAARMLASPHRIELDVLSGETRPVLAESSREAEAKRRYDMGYQAELRWWAGHSADYQGIPAAALLTGAETERVPVARRFPAATSPGPPSGAQDRAELVVLSSDGDTIGDWLHVGEALSVVLLEFTRAGEATCALTHITELPGARRTLEQLVAGHGVPQVLIRVGRAPVDAGPAPVTSRRPVEEILTVLPNPAAPH
ncbi:Acg family FMN-binding oxidoreductase [Nocardia sp. SSK8]|uniref:Acg family FMN-binding oxidoreductase n=1 Tax=Nocardia sp. SSK8 TaxID=3120154 RepID=UPI003008DA12